MSLQLVAYQTSMTNFIPLLKSNIIPFFLLLLLRLSLLICSFSFDNQHPLQKGPLVDEIDEDDFDAKDSPQVDHESDDEIIESDIELEGEIVEADNDPPQKVSVYEYHVNFLLL